MPRSNRISPGGMVFHVLNRVVGRQRLVDKPADYEAFESIIEETLAKQPMRICSYCLMPNHWHFVLWPEHDDHLAAFMQRLTVTHVTRWQKHRCRVGEGRVYQARFKSFPVGTDDYFYQIVRSRNAMLYGQILFRWRRNGNGRACGGSFTELQTSAAGFPPGRCLVHERGPSWSTNLKQTRNYRPCGVVSFAGALTVLTPALSKLPNNWDWNSQHVPAGDLASKKQGDN